MATIYVDGRAHEADPNRNLLETCLELGMDLPYFCWHPAMGSVGACRQCAVKQYKDETDQKGKLVMACMTPAANGTRIAIYDPEAVAFRKGIIEGLMVNHPHDCPVCDEGGECHLQDMTVMTGHDYRRYEFRKRTFRNQYLGPFLNHEMNRCIQCYRCVRFYREYAGGHDFNSFALRDVVYFGRERDGVLENEFAGNLVEVCPTGVFTDATLKQHYTRKWDLRMAPSLCVHCGLGCNIDTGERYGLLRRVVNRFNGEVNGYFLCDRGRYGYEFVNSPKRILHPRLSGQPVSAEAALEHFRRLLEGPVIGIGSPRASIESNFALRELVGAERFYSGMAEREGRVVARMIDALRRGPARAASLAEVERSDAVLVLGEDVTNTGPRMALALRQSVLQQPMAQAARVKLPLWLDHAVRQLIQDQRGPLIIATPYATKLDEVASETWRGAPDDIARLGFAVAHALDPRAPAVEGVDGEIAARIAAALKGAKRPLVVSGYGCESEAVIEAAASVARALPGAALAFTTPECNSFGVALLGKTNFPPFAEIRGTVIVLENDLYRRWPREVVDDLLARAEHVVVLDSLETETTRKAELVLPAGAFAESSGTLVSSEGRAQRFYRVFPPEVDVRDSWRWLGPWERLDDAIAAVAQKAPELAGIVEAAPPADLRLNGAEIPRAPHRDSGRTAMLAHISVHEPKPPEDPDSPLSFTMEGTPLQPPPPDIPFFWAPGWNSIQSTNFYQSEVGRRLRGGSPGVRLLEPGQGDGYAAEPPPPFERRQGEWLIVPAWHIFGSGELSHQAPAVAQLAPQPYVALNPEDARALGIAEGEEVVIAGTKLPARIAQQLPAGIAAVPAGLEGTNVWTEVSGKPWQAIIPSRLSSGS